MAMAAPGWWKALTIPTLGPLSLYSALEAYDASQQINGDHPTQVRQQQWDADYQQAYKNQLVQAAMRQQRGGY